MLNRRLKSLAERVLPGFVLRWLDPVQAMIEEEVRLVADAATHDQIILDAGAGEARHRKCFRRGRYIALDAGSGDPAWDYSNLDIRGHLESIPLRARSVDHILCLVVLEHTRDPRCVLAEFSRVLKPGGTLVMIVPFLWEEHQPPHDYFRFTRHGIRLLLTRAGLEVISIEPQGGYFWYLADAIRPLHRRLFGKERPLLFRALTVPLALVSKVLFTALLPWLFFRLDRFDGKRTVTTGHEAVARRPS